MKREHLTKYLKTLWAAHHFVFISQDPRRDRGGSQCFHQNF